MYVQVNSTSWGLAPCVLMERDDFTTFHVSAAAGDDVAFIEKCLESISAGHSADGDHVFISIEWLLENAPARDYAWRKQFDDMVSFARSKGWLSSDGLAIQAHIKRVG